jgi:lactoylglutathione lyase
MKPNLRLLKAWPYQQDVMQLPVADVAASVSYYQNQLGFQLISQTESPIPHAMMQRDDVQMGLAQNGGDPTQDGCFIEVTSVEAMRAELQLKGLNISELQFQKHGDTPWRVFFLVAPDGLCYCFGERQN